jgi:mannose-6-phosphate isomerase class I
LLRADNFTPVARTPWGGTRLASRYKQRVAQPGQVIGESWEVSVEPDFPARLESGLALTDYIAAAPEAVLGLEHHALGRTGTALLVKLLDTAESLSVQIHPDDHYRGLAPGECGKPESWYVVDAAKGAGLYLGFRPGVQASAVRAALLQGESLEPLLHFIPVQPGDFFVIEAGMPHAIGAGLTLVEPQHVLPGQRGVTYRYWDWNRRYDASGRASAEGEPRPLHLEHALAVTDWARFQSPGFAERIHLRAAAPARDGAPQLTHLAGGDGLASSFLAVSRLTGTGPSALPYRDRLQSLTVLEGRVDCGGMRVEQGRSAVVPACAAQAALELAGAHAIVCAVA